MTMVYCGPTVRNLIRQYFISEGIPEYMNKFLEEHPIARSLFVPIEKFPETRVKLETKGSREYLLYNKLKKEM